MQHRKLFRVLAVIGILGIVLGALLPAFVR